MVAMLESVLVLLVIVSGAFAAMLWGQAVGEVVFAKPFAALFGYSPGINAIAGGITVFFAVAWFGTRLVKLFHKDAAGESSLLTRRPVGYLWRAFAFTVAAVLYYALFLIMVGLIPQEWRSRVLIYSDGNPVLPKHVVGVAWLLLLLFGGPFILRAVKTAIGKATAPLRHVHRLGKAGKGGSASFAGLLEEWAHPWRKGGIFLGNSLYDPGWKVGLTDNRHVLTIAATRAGKGRSAIIPNLLTWPHSALVIDPKGTNAAVTAGKRGTGLNLPMRQKVYCLNPFKVNRQLEWMPPSSCFNPLSIIDLEAATVYEDLDLLADALVIPASKDPFWDESAKGLIRALIGHAISINPQASLFDVRAMLPQVMDQDSLLLAAMMENDAASGVIRNSATQLAKSDSRLVSNIISTALSHLGWLSSPAMEETLSRSDFSIFDLKASPTTVYVVLPPEYLETHNRFMRLFVNLAIKAASMEGRSKAPILFVLDEFYSLGRMQLLAKAVGLLGGYNVKLWPILQNLSQLAELYPENWETFIANAGHLQIFGINDQITAGYVTEKLGRAVIYEDVRGPDGRVRREAVSIAELRDAGEIGREVSRKSSKQLVFREGETPFLLTRSNYDRSFRKGHFDPDPDYAR